MNSDEIRKLQAVRDKLRHEAHKENSDDDSWVAFRAVRNKIKSVINKSKRVFVINAFSSIQATKGCVESSTPHPPP